MVISYDNEKLERIARDIHNITGMSISVLDKDYRVLTNISSTEDYCSKLQEKMEEKNLCMECDEKILKKCAESKSPEFHICRAGFYDCALPIIKSDTVVAYVIMGRIRSESSPKLEEYSKKTGDFTPSDMETLYKTAPFVSLKQLKALYDLLTFVLFESAVKISYNPMTENIISYIDENLGDSLGISKICERFHISKNSLYKAFQTELGVTVCEYITNRRISRAMTLLSETDLYIREIAEMVGIENYTYFCRLFKNRTGQTPKEYRAELS